MHPTFSTPIIPLEHTTGAITLKEEAKTPEKLMELPPKTRELLACLDDDDISFSNKASN
ncbi:hypothetical protein [Ensifer sp. LC163]|uniref:hypothetical protein n=1 Tax=Ensifer sp. LC163 TaxID=1120652 RepID=UPI001374761F|nr:hypothetical protein [Ensifer sp. LC163]